MNEIKKLICQDLNVKEAAVKIEPIQKAEASDPFDRGPTRYVITGIRVTINNLV